MTSPIVISAEIGNINSTTLAVTFDKEIYLPYSDITYIDGVVIKVNDVSVSISNAVISGDSKTIYYTIPEIEQNDVITWQYTMTPSRVFNPNFAWNNDDWRVRK